MQWATSTFPVHCKDYIGRFGNDPIATESSPYMELEENFNKWTLKEWKDGVNKDNGWYIDDYVT